ncbi:hypothetical protein ACRAWF_40615 [Streptomyces sp. L7]
MAGGSAVQGDTLGAPGPGAVAAEGHLWHGNRRGRAAGRRPPGRECALLMFVSRGVRHPMRVPFSAAAAAIRDLKVAVPGGPQCRPCVDGAPGSTSTPAR